MLQRRALDQVQRHYRCAAGAAQPKPLLHNKLLLQAVPQESRGRLQGQALLGTVLHSCQGSRPRPCTCWWATVQQHGGHARPAVQVAAKG